MVKELKYDIDVGNNHCDVPFYTLHNIPESRIMAIIEQEKAKGNYAEVLF